MTLAEIMQMAATQALYIRWTSDINGDIRRGHSRNHQTGALESGLSVNPLRNDVLSGASFVAGQILEYQYLSIGTGARAYLLTGDVAGRGSDNEPVISSAQVIGEISDAVLAEVAAVVADAQRAAILDTATRYPWLSGRDLARQVARTVGCWPEDAARVLNG